MDAVAQRITKALEEVNALGYITLDERGYQVDLNPGWELQPAYWLPTGEDPDEWLTKLTRLIQTAAGDVPVFVNVEA